MSLIKKIMKKIVTFDIDAYFIFREIFSELENFEFVNLPGFDFVICDSENDDNFKNLLSIWITGKYAGFESEESAHQYLKTLFSSGDICMLAMKDGLAAGMMWATGKKSTLYEGFASCVKNDENFVVIHRTYVLESFRGYRLHRYMDWNMKVLFSERGKSGSYAFVGPKNWASLKNRMKTNRELKLIYHVSVDLFSIKINLFPKLNLESWVLAKNNETRWLP